MEYEKQTEAQAHLYPTSEAGGQYPPPYASVQSPNPGGMAYPQQPAYSQPYHPANPNQPYGQAGYPVATQQPYGQAGYPSGQAGSPAYGYAPPGSVGYGQPQPIVVTTGHGQQVVAQQTTVSMIGAIVLSCFVLWCCGCLCGLIAFIVALVGQSKSSDGKAQSAIQLRNASYGISVAGIIVGIILTVLLVLYQNNQHR